MTDPRRPDSPEPGATRGPSTGTPSTAGDPSNASEALRALAALRGDAFEGSPSPASSHELSQGSSQGFSKDFSKGFDLLEEIGRGAFGVVYRGRDRALGREVAIKTSLSAFRALPGGVRKRILSEARALAAIDHPNVVRIHSVDEADGQIQIVMELLRGRSLHDWVKLLGPASADEAAQIGLKLCGALAAIHSAGLIHRDVKPANVMRVEGGRIVLLDLGFASEVAPQSGESAEPQAGTPLLMAPEQFERGAALDARADIYALGVTLYWLVSARFPVEGRNLVEIAQAVRQGRSTPLRDRRPSISAEFAAVVDRATALSPQDRFASAGEFERALQRWIGVHTADVRVEGPLAVAGPSPGSSERAKACTSCGAARVGDESYCKSCGSMLVYPCPRCASAIDLDARFCSRCGLDVTQWRAAEEQLRTVQAALRRGEFVAARRGLAAVRELAPSHTELPRVAEDLERREKSFEAASGLARAAEEERRFDAARDAWSRALEHAPENKSARDARERAHDLARSAALAKAVASVQRAFDHSNWAQARAALEELETLALPSDAPLVERGRQQVTALERRLERARAGTRAAYERRELAAFEACLGALRESGEEQPQLTLRERELAVLRGRAQVLEFLDQDLAPQAVRAMRELRKLATDWPRVELAALEKRVLAVRAAQLERAPGELADLLRTGGVGAGEEFVESMKVLRPDAELLSSLEALIAAAITRRKRWRVVRAAAASIALGGLGAGTYWTLRLLRESTSAPIAAKEVAPAPAATHESLASPESMAEPKSSSTPELRLEIAPGPVPTAGDAVTGELAPGADTSAAPASDSRPDESLRLEPPIETVAAFGPVVSTSAWPVALETAVRGSRAQLAASLRGAANGVSATASALAAAPRAVSAPAARPKVASPAWLAELALVLEMSGARVTLGEGPLRAGVLWAELERAFRARIERWSTPGESLGDARVLLELFERLRSTYVEFFGNHALVMRQRGELIDRLEAWRPGEFLGPAGDGSSAQEIARQMIEAAKFAPAVQAWLESVLALEPTLLASFDIASSDWAVVSLGEDSPRAVPARLRHREDGLVFVAVADGPATFYICESKLGREALPYAPSQSKLLRASQELLGLSPLEARQWTQLDEVDLDLPTTREWELAFRSAPLHSAVRTTIEIGLAEVCQGRFLGEHELYACAPGRFAETAVLDSAVYALRPVRRNVLRDASAAQR